MNAPWTQERIDATIDRYHAVTPEILLREVEDLARKVQGGGQDWETVDELVFAMRVLRARDHRHPKGQPKNDYGAYLSRRVGPRVDLTPNPRYGNDVAISTCRWIDREGYGFGSTSAGQIRAVWPATAGYTTETRMDLDTRRTLPGVLPEDDDAPVLVYEVRLHVAQLLNGIAKGEDIAGRLGQLLDRQVKGTLYPSEDPWSYRD